MLHGRPVKDYVALLLRKPAERHVRPHSEFPRYILHQRPHQRLPRQHSTFIYCERFIRHQGRLVHSPDESGTAAGLAGPLTVEGKFFSSRRIKMFPAHRTHEFLTGGYRQCRFEIMPVRATMARKSRKHQPEVVQQFRRSAESTADPGYAGTLVQRKGCGDMHYVFHLSLGRLGHPASGISCDASRAARKRLCRAPSS